ncbi:MAG: pyridoxal phosphate-dependent aminotransferase family protein [Deltaproteobacteria bacterium]|nr:pyridoxal phosphate-dependent aminotransferase family protein [Deltaproteobacteria bacterium]
MSEIPKDNILSITRPRELHPRAGRIGAEIEILGKRLVDFTNWDIFALNENRDFLKAAQVEIEKSGFGGASPRTSGGTSAAHASCEKRIAQFLGVPAALLTTSKFAALQALVSEFLADGDILLVDEQMQLPVTDLIKLCRTPAVPFVAANPSSLESELSKCRSAKRKFVLMEHISPATGRKQDFSALLPILQRHAASVILDESCAMGMEGLRGAGGSENPLLSPSIFFQFGEISTFIPSSGAFLAGSSEALAAILQGARSLYNDIAIPPACASAAEAAINMLELSHAARERLRESVAHFRAGLSSLGFLDALQSDSPIVSVMVGASSKAEELSKALIQRGFFTDTAAISTPYSNVGFLRMVVSVRHTGKMLDELMQAISDVYKRLPKD